MKFRVMIEPDEDGVFVAECPALPGCISQGKTRDEALANIKDAMTGYLASLKKHGEPVPPPINEEIVRMLSELFKSWATSWTIKPAATSFYATRKCAGSRCPIIASWPKGPCGR